MPTRETIREATRPDVADIQRVARETWHATYDEILGADAVDAVLDEWYATGAIEASIANEAQEFLVATLDDQLVGFANAGPHPPRQSRQLYRLYVTPDQWGKGIGTHLLARIEEALVERGYRRYEVEVLAENDRAVRFYESRNFERVESWDAEMAGVSVTEYRYEKPI